MKKLRQRAVTIIRIEREEEKRRDPHPTFIHTTNTRYISLLLSS